MISSQDIDAIKSEKIIYNIFKVKRVGHGVYRIIGFNYGVEEVRFTGTAEEIARYLNGYFGAQNP